nr:SAM-dependent methyltransferase [Microbacterium barkeri]
MTVRARRLIAEADVLVIDRLGPAEEVVRGLDADVEVIDVGKLPGRHAVPQDEINRIIVARAAAGSRVVRLKGGDPFVFGRGGEEMQACLSAGIPVDVTPGISSAIAVPQSAGIPVTHRGTAAAFHVVNGHGDVGAATRAAMLDPTVTTIVLMGVAALERLAATALDAGTMGLEVTVPAYLRRLTRFRPRRSLRLARR